MNLTTLILKTILFFIIFIVALLIAATITGHDKRSYFVLNPDDIVEINNQKIYVTKLASIYKPKMYLRSSTPSPSLLWVWYEAVPTENTVDIVYYYAWENEIHPNPNIHKFYSLVRSVYYGYPLYDIEYFQISVGRSDGVVKNIRFETSPGEDYFVTISEHVVARYIYIADGNYNEILSTRDGGELNHTDDYQVRFEKDHVLAGVQTWNHLSLLLSESDDEFDVLQDAPLKSLTNAEYSRFKFVRKSQCDHQTIENKWTMFLSSVIIFIFMVLPGKLMAVLSRKRKSENHEHKY